MAKGKNKGTVTTRDWQISSKYGLYTKTLVEGGGTMTIGEEVEIDYIHRRTLMIGINDKAYKCHYQMRWQPKQIVVRDFHIFQRVSDNWQNGLYYFVGRKDGIVYQMFRSDVVNSVMEEYGLDEQYNNNKAHTRSRYIPKKYRKEGEGRYAKPEKD